LTDIYVRGAQRFKELSKHTGKRLCFIQCYDNRTHRLIIPGVPLSKIPTVWAPNEPDNYKNNEDCIVMLKNGTFADTPCCDTFPYVCYKKMTTNIVVNDCGTIDDGKPTTLDFRVLRISLDRVVLLHRRLPYE
jgi:hypothetical protein